jgi:hypothetical protein
MCNHIPNKICDFCQVEFKLHWKIRRIAGLAETRSARNG